jgi:hypothetical protein
MLMAGRDNKTSPFIHQDLLLEHPVLFAVAILGSLKKS